MNLREPHVATMTNYPNRFKPLPLGTPVPNSPHAVVVSLPTMTDVIGYEERRPDTMDVVRSGYPRFLQHPFVTQAMCELSNSLKLGARALFPVASLDVARRIADLCGVESGDVGIAQTDGWVLLHLPPADAALAARVRKIIQHTGVALGSRQAEDWLVARGLRDDMFPEETFDGDASAAVRRVLAHLLAPAAADDILLCRSGMNAFYAAFEAVRSLQCPRGRTHWLQLGWLYTDTTETLRKCLPRDEPLTLISNVFDKDAVEKFFADNGDRVAAVVTEVPTNPLIQTPDIEWLCALARRYGAILVLDPSTSGLVNVDLLRHSDVLVTSLTKYAAHAGDVMLGVLCVNPCSPVHEPLLAAARREISFAYERDISRLAVEIESMSAVAVRVNDNTARLAAWLAAHPAVRRVFWAGEASSAANYAAIARSPERFGCVISIELTIQPARFYDRIKRVKGPSFGTDFTIVSPFIYMAHYDLVTSAAGRKGLIACGIDPELMRISVGCEPFEEIRDAFASALA
ncbi:MAG: PLP-dependent transferase [Puniceicoccales bacterium]|nr:PLP-dependent transferase [Puniceicoccales bacterium]